MAWAGQPQHEVAWARGAAGERAVGAMLADLEPDGVLSLNDRRVPRSRANIDHIAVCASGVWIVDAKHWGGGVQVRDRSGLFSPTDLRLIVGRRDRTAQVEKLDRQVEVVHDVLDTSALRGVPVHAMLAIVGASWPLLRRQPYAFGSRLVGHRAMVQAVLRREGPLSIDRRRELHAILDRALPPA